MPTNPYDSNAVAVYIEGLKVGHISREVNRPIFRSVGEIRGDVGRWPVVPCRVWALGDDGVWKSSVILDPTEPLGPEFTYVDNVDGVGAASDHRLFRPTPDALDEWRDSCVRRGSYRGKYYEDYREAIYELVKERRWDAALDVLPGCSNAAYRFADSVDCRPAAWPTDRLAVVYRSLKRYGDEVRTIEKYLRTVGPADGTKQLRGRLKRACELAGRRESKLTAAPPAPPPVTPVWSALVDPMPTRELAVSEDMTVWTQKQYLPAVNSVLQSGAVPPGEELECLAVVREDGWEAYVVVYIEAWRVGHVSALFSWEVKQGIRDVKMRGYDVVVRCSVAAAGDRRIVLLRPTTPTASL